MFKLIIKEASILTAFVVLGGILLMSFWLSYGFDTGIMAEYKDSKVSLSFENAKMDELRGILEKDRNVVRYEVSSSEENKRKLGELYPELKSVMGPLENKLFPASALVTVREVGSFLKKIEGWGSLIDRHLVHEPPHQLANFLRLLTGAFLLLWVMTLGLVIYFNVDRIVSEQEGRWSLMKMLGAKPYTLFLPVLYGQGLRIFIASAFSILLAIFASGQVRQIFAWNWSSLPMSVWLGFFITALIMTGIISSLLCQLHFKRISLG